MPGSWIVVKDASCTEEGLKVLLLPDGTYGQTETIPATGHSWSDGGAWSVPLFQQSGADAYRIKRCAGCGHEERQIIDGYVLTVVHSEGKAEAIIEKKDATLTLGIPYRAGYSFEGWLD